MQPCISTTVFHSSGEARVPLERVFEAIAKAGFHLIELSRKNQEIADLPAQLADAGLSVWSVHGRFGNSAISCSDDERRKTIENEIRRMEISAAHAPCPYVIHYLNRRNDPAVGEFFKTSVEQLLKRAEALSLSLAVETVPLKPEVDERTVKSDEVADFVRALDSPHATVCVDVNHSNCHENLVDVARNCSGLISNIHVSDNHGHREEHLFPGDGIIDFPEALQALLDAGYTGPLNLECHGPANPTMDELIALRTWAEQTIAVLRV
jgi:sugar phosphate isomerase/epimerase